PAEASAVTAVVETRGLAGLDVDALDPAARIAPRRARASAIEARDLMKEKAAVVAVVVAAVRSDRDPVGPAAELRQHLDRAVGRNVGDGFTLDFDDDDGAVLLRDRPLRKEQAGRHDAEVRHPILHV